jgi:hypothetical protein
MSTSQKQFHERLDGFLQFWLQNMFEELELRTNIRIQYSRKNLEQCANLLSEYMSLHNLAYFYEMEDLA